MFCPQCKAEYRSGFVSCSECGVPLVSILPEKEPEFDATSELVVIRHYTNVVDIDLARSVLESAGVKSMIRGGNYGARGMGTSAILGYELVVKADDVDDANEILDAGDG